MNQEVDSTVGKDVPSRSKLYRRNVLGSALLQTSNIAMTLVLPRVMIAEYGSDQNGLIASITQLIAMILVVEAGLTNASMLALYKPLADRDAKRVAALLRSIDRLFKQVAMIFIVAVVIVAIVYSQFVTTASLSRAEVLCLVLVMGLNGLFDFLFYAKYRVFLNAAQRSYLVSLASTAYVLLNSAIIVIAAVEGASIVEGRAVATVAIGAKFLILWWSARRRLPKHPLQGDFSRPPIPQRGDVLFQQILGGVQTGIPTLLATAFAPLEDVSVFSMYWIVSLGIINVLSIVSSAATASFGQLYASRKMTTLRSAYGDLEFAFSLLAGVAFGVCLTLISSFMSLYIDNLDTVNYDVPSIAILVSIYGWLYVLKTPAGALVMAAGHYRQTRYRVLTQGLILVAGGLILAPSLGPEGILIACILSNLYRAIDLAYYVPRRILGIAIKPTLVRFLISAMLLAIMGSAGWVLLPQVDSWYNFFVWGVVLVASGGVLALLIALLIDRHGLVRLMDRIVSR